MNEVINIIILHLYIGTESFNYESEVQNFMKRFLALILALCMCLFPTTAFAMEGAQEESIDYMNYDFHEDAIILYQGEDGVVYETPSNTSDVALASARAMEYGSVWIDANRPKRGSFSVKNPHTLINETGCTIRIQSEDDVPEIQIIMYGGTTILFNGRIKAGNEVNFSFKNNAKSIVIDYSTYHYSAHYGTRVMCWLW